MPRHSRTDRASAVESLDPIADIESGGTPWGQATWVGQVDEDALLSHCIRLEGGEQFGRARLLVWSNEQPRGFIELAVNDGAVSAATLRSAVVGLPEVADYRVLDLPAISVALCTKDRPAQLRRALECLVSLDYPCFEIIVVDNNPVSGLTRPVVDGFPPEMVRLVEAPTVGLSIARNEGLKNARHPIIAFTDDDVIVDNRWLKGLARGFSRSDRVACVCGLVPSAELLTPAQAYFDRRVGWAQHCQPTTYRVSDPPKGDPLFPLRVALYGTGANFAVRKEIALGLGGFDEGLGMGSPTGGGEDIDMFVRVLLEGHDLVREPSAVVWHRHRRSVPELQVQIYNYGLGLGAWIAKLLLRPRTLAMVVRRSVTGIKHLGAVTAVGGDDTALGSEFDGLNRLELRGVLNGPKALLRSRLARRGAMPLRAMPLKSNTVEEQCVSPRINSGSLRPSSEMKW